MLMLSRLEDVLRVLQPLQAKRASYNLSDPLRTTSLEQASGKFGVLNDGASFCEADLGGVEEANKESMDVEPRVSNQSLQMSAEDVLLEDDDIGEWIELSFYLYVRFQNNIYHISNHLRDLRNWIQYVSRLIPTGRKQQNNESSSHSLLSCPLLLCMQLPESPGE